MSESAGCPVRLPVPLMLARPIRVLPDAPGAVYEAKLDGVRAVYGAGRLWSRHHKQLHVPEVIAAARGLGDGVVLDGELVVFAAAGRCDFPAVCRRLHSPAPPAVTYVAFDLLAADGRDLRALPYRHRRLRLTDLLAHPPPHLQLMPATDDVAEAADWYASPLVEGLVIKPVEAPYPRVRDQRRWQKLRSVRVCGFGRTGDRGLTSSFGDCWCATRVVQARAASNAVARAGRRRCTAGGGDGFLA